MRWAKWMFKGHFIEWAAWGSVCILSFRTYAEIQGTVRPLVGKPNPDRTGLYYPNFPLFLRKFQLVEK